VYHGANESLRAAVGPAQTPYIENPFRHNKTVVTVSTHKTGDKEPAILVIGHSKAELMER